MTETRLPPAGMSNRVKGARYCPVGSGCEVRWMTLAG